MSKNSNNEDVIFFAKIFSFLRRKKKVKKGDLGVYKDVLIFNTIGNTTKTIQYDIFVKVKALEVYDQLVEVEVLDIMLSDTVSESMSEMVKQETIRYLNPSDVKWQVNN